MTSDPPEPADAPIEVAFDFTGVGVGDIRIRLGDEVLLLGGLCYGSDAVGDLVRLTLALATGAAGGECSFDLEPDELRLVAARLPRLAGTIDLSAFRLAEWGAPLAGATAVSSVRCTIDDLAGAVVRGVSTALEARGADGYRAVWGWEFPARALAALVAALALPPPEVTLGPSFPGEEPLATYHIFGSNDG